MQRCWQRSNRAKSRIWSFYGNISIYFPVRTMQLAIHAGVRATLSRQRSRRFRIIRSFRQREWAECECRSALIF